MAIHVDPTATVDPSATLDDGVYIGPYCVVSGGAFIGAGTRLHNNVTIMGNVRIGSDNVIFPNCVIGADPQDIGYRGEPTWVVIGDRNTFREGMTVHRATTKEFGVTRIGSDNYFMAMVHIAHDCNIGSKIMIANLTQISGHAQIEDGAVISGMCAIHHFATIGKFAFLGGMSGVRTDVPPFMFAEGVPCEILKINLVGLRRNGYSRDDIHALGQAHHTLYRSQLVFDQAVKRLEDLIATSEPVRYLVDFLRTQRTGVKGRAKEGRRAA